jgi:PAS domain S-box-containing protein
MFRYALEVFGLAAVYGAAGVLGLQFAQPQANTTLVWPASGIALSAVLLLGPRCWPGITLGALLVCALVPTALLAAPAIGAGNTLEALAGAWLLRRGGFQPELQRVRDVVLLVAAAALASTTLSATAGVTAIWLTQPGVDYTTVWLSWWLGDALGDLVMAPLLLTWLTPSAWPRSRLAEAGLGLGLLVLLGGCLFGGWLSRGQEWTTSYLAFPILIWAALRLGPRGAATATFLLTLLTVGGTARGVGPFAGRPLEEGLFLLHTFMGVAAGTALLLAAVLAERRRAEDALAKSEALYRPIVENQTEFIVRWLPDGTRTFVNDSYCRYFGLTAEQCLGTSFFPLVAPEDRDMIRRKIAALSPEHPTASDEHRVLCPDGQVRWNQWTDRGIFDSAGRLVELQSVGRDITDRKRAELALQESQRFLSSLVGHLPGAAYRCRNDPDWTIEFISDGCRALTGHSPDDFMHGRVTWGGQVIFPDDRQPVWEQVQAALAARENYQLVYRIQHKNGSLHWVSEQGGGVFAPGGELLALEGFVTDVTEQKRALEALRASEERYRFLFEHNLAGVLQTARDGQILQCNESFARMLGYSSADDLRGRTMWDFYFDPAERRHLLQRLEAQRSLTNHEIRFRRADGTPLWVLANVSLRDDNCEVLHGTLIDITERKRADEAIQESERRYRTLVEHAPEAIVILDADSGRFIDANENAVRLYGLERDRLLQVGPFELSPPTQPDGRDSRAAGMDFIRRALAGAVPVFEWVHRNAAGDDIPCEVRLVRLPAEGRRLIRGSVSDIRARKQLEERLRQAERLQSIGQLAGGVAHDFNNLLTIINGYTDLLLDQVAPDHPWHSFVEEVHKAGERAAALTRQLLAFGRRQFLQPVVLDLNREVTQLGELLRRLIGARIQLVTELDPALQPIRADRSQIEQVLLNLVVNARDAMPQGGRLTIATANVILGEADVLARPELRPGAYVRLTVSDTGCGMAPQTRARIFEPFFTTKEIGKGTGLGLATVYGIVKQSGGHIEFTSELGRGTSFWIDLPAVAAQPLDPGELLPDLADLPRGSETILLVEDEAAVRLLARRVLQQSGYVVLDAPDGPAALQLVARHEGPIHLLSGPELVHRLQSARPEIKVLYISGYAENTLGQHSVAAAEVRLLKKPFPPTDLVRAVREVLDGSPSDRYQI